MQKWEHLQITWGKFGKQTRLTFVGDQDMNKEKIDFWTYLHQLGEQDWQVVDTNWDGRSFGRYVLKRPKE